MPTTRTLFPVILGSGGPSGNYAVNLNMSMDSSYVISAQLVDQNGNALGTERTIDLPLESVVVNGSYDSQTESIILTLQNGNTITIPVSGLVSGLREVIEVTDMTQSQLADFYTNYATLMETNTYVVNGYSFNTLIMEGDVIVLVLQYGAYNYNRHAFQLNEFIIYSDGTTTTDTWELNISTVAITGSYSSLTEKPILGTMAAESASDYTPTSGLATVATTGSYPDLHNRPSLATVATSGSYSDLTNKPTIPAAQVNSDWNAVSGVSQVLNKPSMTTETLTFIDANNVSTTVVVWTQPQI